MSVKKIIGLVLVSSFLAAGASAQPATAKPQFLAKPDKPITYMSAADVAKLIAQAKKERKDNNALVVGTLLQTAPKNGVFLEYRDKSNPRADVGNHPNDDEIVYIVEGSGTLVTGGTVAADKMSITGGESRKFAKGDFILIPAGTPHWISEVTQTIAQVSLHIPKSAP